MVQGNAVNGNRAAASWVERDCGEVRKPKIVFHFGDDLSGADFGNIFDYHNSVLCIFIGIFQTFETQKIKQSLFCFL